MVLEIERAVLIAPFEMPLLPQDTNCSGVKRAIVSNRGSQNDRKVIPKAPLKSLLDLIDQQKRRAFGSRVEDDRVGRNTQGIDIART